MSIESIQGGTVTSPKGFRAGAIYAGIKKARNSLDLGMLVSDAPCLVAAVFTTSSIKAAPVVLCQQRLRSGKATAVVVNSGCANASTGEPGLADAAKMAELAASKVSILPKEVLVASTGVIGKRLPMELIEAGLERVAVSADGGHKLAKAIMTTDTAPKEIGVSVKVNGGEFIIGGIAKGAGMIHPNLATMLCFLTTDAVVEAGLLKSALQRAAGVSFNMISVDGDTSPNDTLLILANGLAGNKLISSGSQEADIFQQALNQVCIYLAKSIARDGEGATRLIEVTVHGAISEIDASIAARTIVSSPLVKAAVHGNDPNWGRIIAALGRSGAALVESKIDLYIGEVHMVEEGRPLPFNQADAVRVLEGKEVSIRLNLNLGKASATAWGCDLSEEYVKINSQYTT